MANILIIDDDHEIAGNLAIALSGAGHRVETLETTEGALEKIAAAPPDLLVLDVMFPGNPAAGFDLAREIRRRREIRALPVIMLTGVNQEFPMDFSAADMDDDWMPVQAFLEKPVDLNALLEKIGALLPAGR